MKTRTDKIRDVVFKYEALDTKEAKELVIGLWNRLKQLQDKKTNLYMAAQEAEKEITGVQEKLSNLNKICTIEFEESEIQDKQVEQCNLVIVNPDDARNK